MASPVIAALIVPILDEVQDRLTEDFPVSVDHSTFQLESPAHAAHELAAHE